MYITIQQMADTEYIYDNDGILDDGIDDGLADDVEAEAEADIEDVLGDELPEEAIGDGEGEGVGETDEFEAEEQLDDGTDDITQYSEILKDAQVLAQSDQNIYKTGKFLYKYEYPRIVSSRATAIQNGAPPLIQLVDPVTGRQLRDPMDIAEEELRQGKLPLMVDRPLPGKAPYKQTIEQRPLSTLIF